MMIVLSLSSSWDVSIEGMVPDIERSRAMIVVVVVEKQVVNDRASTDLDVISHQHCRCGPVGHRPLDSNTLGSIAVSWGNN